MFTKINKKHNKIFKKQPSMFFSPAKLKLMGDYIEHTGGSNISCLLDVGVYATTSKSKFNTLKILDTFNKDSIFEIDLETLEKNGETPLLKLIYLIVTEFIDRGYDLPVGINIILFSNIPFKSGVNLNETIIMLLTKILNSFNSLNLKDSIIINICEEVYKKYYNVEKYLIGLNEFNYKPNNASMFEINKNKPKYIDVNFEDFSLVLIYDKEMDKEVQHLVNERITDSVSAHMILDSKYKHKYLCDYTVQELNEYKDEVRDFEFKRTRHAITENNRVKELYNAFKEDNIAKIGNLFTLSHNSLLQDYEITTKQQDMICNLVARYNSLGSKMISSSYNNSVFILVKDLQIDNLITQVSKEYKSYFNTELGFVVTHLFNKVNFNEN